MKTKQIIVVLICLISLLVLLPISVSADYTIFTTSGRVYLREADGVKQFHDDQDSAWVTYDGTLTFQGVGVDGVTVENGTHDVLLYDTTIDVSDMNDECAFEIASGASVNLMLRGINKIFSGRDCSGINVPEGASLSITHFDGYINDYTNNAVSLVVNGDNWDGCAGIGGGNNQNSGLITINGGHVEVIYSSSGASIGGGYGGNGNVIITGGITVAENGIGVGIGGGYGGNGNVVITGGTVYARGGGDMLADIGNGYDADENEGKVIIRGGSVDAETVTPTPLDKAGNALIKKEIGGAESTIWLGIVGSDNSYGSNDLFKYNSVYFWLPQSSDDISVSYGYKVDFDACGGFPVASRGIVSDSSFGSAIMNTARSGYKFNGWYTGRDGEGTRLEPDTPIYSNTTFYAYWTPEINVVYLPGSEAEVFSGACSDTKTAGENLTLASGADTITRWGYRIVGWATSDGGEKVYDLGEVYSADESIVLYPVWAITITYVKNGDFFNQTDGHSTAVIKTKGEPITLDGSVFESDFYDFIGWATTENGEKVYEPNSTYTDDVSITLYPLWNFKFTTVTEENRTSLGLDASHIGYIIIDSAEKLRLFSDYSVYNNTTAGANAVLTADIDLNPGYSFNADGTYSGGTSPRVWTPIGNNEYNYIGTFEGNNKTVSGIYINGSESDIGLFGYIIIGGKVQNVTVANSYINGNINVGGVCGRNEGGSITNCSNSGAVGGNNSIGGVCGYNSGDITNCYNTGAVSGSTDVGGVCGMNENGSNITNCYNTGTVSGEEYIGGVCGQKKSSDCIIESCYNIGDVSGTSYVGGVCGWNEDNSITYCYNTGTVSGTSYVGGVCGLNEVNATVENCYNIGEVSGTSYVGGVCGSNNGTILQCYYRTGCAKVGSITQYGIGSSDNHQVSENEYITAAKSDNEFADGTVTKLLNVINEPLVWYQGSEYPRLIPYRASESDPYEIYTADDLFWFAAYVNAGNNSISGKLMEDIDLNSGYTFTFIPDTGLVELKYGEEIKGYFGTGIKGESGGTNSTFDTDDSDKGAYYSTEYEATDEPDYLRTWTPIGNDFTTYTGDFNGNNHTVSGLYFNDSGRGHVGLFGSFGNHVIYDEYNTTCIENSISNIGVINSYIRGSQEAGGICGRNEGGTISDCYNSGIVIGDNYVGGVCGWSTGGTITNCYNTGAVNGGNYVGGVCGWNENNSSITNCYNTGAVNGYTYVGGVCGCSTGGTITICYNTGTVNGNTQVGGVCGWNENNSSITNCYNIGAVNGKTDVGSVYGWNNNGQIENCYYLAESDNESDGKTAAQFANGNVAWLLNTNGGSSANSEEWSQGRNYPIFKDDTHKAIYKISVSGAKNADYYTDATGKCAALETLHGDGISAETVYTNDAEYTADAAITGVTPTVTDSIRFTYHVTAARDLIPILDIIFGSKTVNLTSTPLGEGDYLNYDFTFEGILPQQMTENIAAKLMISGTQYATKSQYSVKAYVFNQLPASDKTLEKFLVNMLYYGEAAQLHLDRTENLATEGLDALLGEAVIANYRTSDSAWNTLLPETVKNVTDTYEGDIITWKSATLVFDKTITMRLRFTAPASTVIPLDYKFNNTIPFSDAVNEKTEEGITTYYIDITGFTPTDYEDIVTMTLYDNSSTPEAVSEEVTYSVMSYIRSKKDSASMMVLVRALYDYGISGKAYKGV